MTPEQLFQIQQALITLGFFYGEADGEFGPMTRTAIRRYQAANNLPQNDFLSNEQRVALSGEGTVRSVADASHAGATSAPSQGTPPPPSPPQQSASPQPALAKPFAEPGRQYCNGFGATVAQVVNDEAERASRKLQELTQYNDLGPQNMVDTVVRDAIDALYKRGRPAFFDPAYARELAVPGLDPRRRSKNAVSDVLVTAVASLDDATSRTCFPKLAAFLDKYRDLKQQAKAKQAAEAAEAQRQEAERRKQTEARRLADIARTQRLEAELRKPANRVTEGYVFYRLARRCNQVRRGYAVQYVNDDELERATTAIQAVVKAAKNNEPNINTDSLWDKSAERANGRPIGAESCQAYLQELLRISPGSVYDEAKPPE